MGLTGNPESFEVAYKDFRTWLNVTVTSPAREHFVAVYNDITAHKRAESELLAFNDHIRQSEDLELNREHSRQLLAGAYG